MGRRKTNAASGLVALVILCIVSLFLFTLYVKEGDSGPLHTVQLGAAEVLRPARSAVAAASSPVDALKERVGGNLGGEEEAELRRQAQENAELAAQASVLERENARLRELLDSERPTYTYGPLARVIAPVGGEFTDRIVINVGTEDGVRPEMPVVVGDNTLVGRTTGMVTANTAVVVLVTDSTFAAGVRIVPPANFEPGTGEVFQEADSGESTYGTGLLRTNWEGYLGVDYVDLSSEVQRGDFVVTSGRAGERDLLFPPGLLVGTVESVSSRDIDQYKKIVVGPAVDPEDLDHVRVIQDW
jgi:rod shape-determining protein MreC